MRILCLFSLHAIIHASLCATLPDVSCSDASKALQTNLTQYQIRMAKMLAERDTKPGEGTANVPQSQADQLSLWSQPPAAAEREGRGPRHQFNTSSKRQKSRSKSARRAWA